MVFVRNKDEMENTYEFSEFCFVQSLCVPYNTQLIILPQNKNYSDLHPNATDSIFIVDVWTFLNSESMETAKIYRQKYPYTELRIVMVNTNRKTLSTDISDVQTALDNAVFEYKQEGFSVTLIQNNDISKLFFWENRRYKDMLKRDFKEKLQSNINSMEFNYDLHYGFLREMLREDMLQPETLDEYTRYDENAGISKINKIADIAAKSFFGESSLFTDELYSIYKAFTKGVGVWEENKIFGNLLSLLARRFRKDMKQALPPVGKNLLNEISYHEFMLNTKFNAIFTQQCDVFFCDTAKDITKLYLDNLMIKMEELI